MAATPVFVGPVAKECQLQWVHDLLHVGWAGWLGMSRMSLALQLAPTGLCRSLFMLGVTVNSYGGWWISFKYKDSVPNYLHLV